MGQRMKQIAFPLVAGLILAATATVGAVTAANQAAALGAQKSALASVQEKLTAARALTGKVQATSVPDSMGASASRVNSDTTIIDDLAKRAMTWNNDASYRDARASTMRIYGLSEDSPFMQAFLPKAPVSVDSKGNVYPYIDAAGLNSQVGNVTVKLLAVNALDYSYLALVDVQAKSSDGIGTSVNVASMLVTIDGAHKVTRLTGFASTQQPRTSN